MPKAKETYSTLLMYLAQIIIIIIIIMIIIIIIIIIIIMRIRGIFFNKSL